MCIFKNSYAEQNAIKRLQKSQLFYFDSIQCNRDIYYDILANLREITTTIIRHTTFIEYFRLTIHCYWVIYVVSFRFNEII